MKTLVLFATLAVGSFSIQTTAVQAQTPVYYQVIDQHPEDMRKLAPYFQTKTIAGRLWIVEMKTKTVPSWVFRHVRRADMNRLRHYIPDGKVLEMPMPKIDDGVMNAIRTENLQASITKLSSYRDRSAGSAENQQAQKWIGAELKAMGYQVRELCYEANHCSVLAEKKGTTKANQIILVEGHFDSVGKDQAGADDNASGTASTLEIARVLKDYKNQHTLQFFLTNGEEVNLLGAAHYAKMIKDANQAKNFKLVINMDMVGYNQNGIVELETNAEFNDLALWFAALTQKYTTLKSKITLGAWGSDHVPFLELGIPTLLTIEDWSTKTPCYHQACDKPETVNYRYATEITKLNAAAVMTRDAE